MELVPFSSFQQPGVPHLVGRDPDEGRELPPSESGFAETFYMEHDVELSLFCVLARCRRCRSAR